MKCAICNSEETIRSFAMHLRWKHPEIKTEEYVKKYGEFRPKNKNILDKKQDSNIECKICNEKLISHKNLIHHIKKHDISWEEYFIKYFFNGSHPLCKCGCGEKTQLIRHGKDDKNNISYAREYIKGHWDWVKPGFNHHSVITKDLMSKKAKQRVQKEISSQGFANIHNPKVLEERRITRKEHYVNYLETLNNVKILNKEEFKTVSSCNLFKYQCNDCNHIWEQKSPSPRCIKCNPYEINNSSLEEKELLEFLYSIYPKNKIITNTRSIISPYEIDIYLPELKLGIEYNGLYWHCEINKPNKKYHYNKFLLSEKNNIKLIQIFSDEWINKKEIVKSRLKNLINKTENKIYARKCIIKEVNPKLKNKFLNDNHIQGEDRSKIKLGLYYKNELVSIMTFGNPRKAIGKTRINEDNEYELIRFCNKRDTIVVGSASKLLTYFIKNYNPKKIYSFADNRWSGLNSNLYSTLGFILKNKSLPGYWYTNNFTERIHRYNFNKNKLEKLGFDINNLTEHEIMNSLKYYQVWDCGVSRYELRIDD